MSHFTVLVAADNYSDLENKLAPYDENDEWGKQGSRWDWWVVGGRWTGLLQIKVDKLEEAKKYMRNGRPGVFTEPNEDRSRCDACLKKYIDFDGMRMEEHTRATTNWKRYRELQEIKPTDKEFEEWKQWYTDADKKRKVQTSNHIEPKEQYYGIKTIGIQRVLDWKDKEWEAGLCMVEQKWHDRVMSMSQDKFAEEESYQAITYAFVDQDGRWHESARMMMFGCSDPDTEMPDYAETYWQWIANLDDDQMLYVVDCHV